MADDMFQILFYEDPEVTRELEGKWPMLKDKFPECTQTFDVLHATSLLTAL